jgi:large subunit ribosomal protein L35
MNVFYAKTKVQDGNYISKQQASRMPEIILNLKPKKLYTVLLMDPDAVGGNKIHFLLTNYSMHNQGNIIFPHVGPNPPKGSGVHRYYFLLIQQESLIIPNLNFPSRYISIEKIFNLLNIPNNQIIAQKYFTSHA